MESNLPPTAPERPRVQNLPKLPPLSGVMQLVRQSLAVRLFIIGLILLLLLIPAVLVTEMISERQKYQTQAVHEIGEKWGGAQLLPGPILQMPGYVKETVWEEKLTQIKDVVKKEKVAQEKLALRGFLLLPETLRTAGELLPEIRYRGIYEAVLYTARIVMEGEFHLPDSRDWNTQNQKQPVTLFFPVSDLTGLRRAELTVNGKPVKPAPGLNNALANQKFNTGFHAPLGEFANGDRISFRIELELNGSENLMFLPLGRVTETSLRSSWAAPSFQGSFLPGKRTVTAQGFTAEYRITELNRNFPQWGQSRTFPALDNQFGVFMSIPANLYQQTNRAAKYAVLFIIATLLALLFTERLSQVAIHPAQYLISGLAVVMFYAILLSSAEHIGFGWGFLLATVLTAGAQCGYSAMIFQNRRIGAVLGALLGLGYTALYFILQLQDYALVAGVGVFFVLLLILMKLTGHMNQIPDETDR